MPQRVCGRYSTVLASVEHSSAILYSYRTVLVYTVLLLTPYEPPALRICTVFAQLSGKYGDQTAQTAASSCKSCGIGEYEHALNDLLTDSHINTYRLFKRVYRLGIAAMCSRIVQRGRDGHDDLFMLPRLRSRQVWRSKRADGRVELQELRSRQVWRSNRAVELQELRQW